MSYKLELPIYYTQKFKTKKGKTFLVGMNWYRNAHYFIQNEVKKHYHDLVVLALSDFKGDSLVSYRVKYKLYYKNPSSDLMNVVSLTDKFFNDAIQELGLVKNDNVKFYKKCFIEVVGQDRENPRVEIELEDIE